MDFLKRNFKRIAIDAAGYLLLIVAALTGWLPGPGGIPLALAGLALLSVNNEWARRIRQNLLDNGGKIAKSLFPDNKYIQWLYDIIVVLLLAVVTVLAYQRAAAWQVALAGGLFFAAVTIALLNRDRFARLQARRKRKQ